MNALRIFYSTCVAAIIAASSMYAGSSHGCGCKPCKKTPVASTEKCLKDIRGTACVSSITRCNGGPITAATIVPRRGVENFLIQNVVINDTNVQPLLGQIFCADCCLAAQQSTSNGCASVTAARVIELQFDVVFTCPFDTEPSVLLTLENSAEVLGNAALLNSVTSIANNVTPFGFTVNIFFSIYGLCDSDIYDLLAGILNPAVTPCFDFVAQAK